MFDRMKLMPGFVLDVNYDEERGYFVLIEDAAKVIPANVGTSEEWRNWLGGQYYLYHAMMSNFEAVRTGIFRIVEVDSFGWNNFSVDFYRRGYSDFMDFYPVYYRDVSWVHSSVVANMLHSLFKSIIGKDAAFVRLGAPFDAHDGRLDELFLQPSKAIAESRLLLRLHEYLVTRLKNQAAFQLPTLAMLEADGNDPAFFDEQDDSDGDDVNEEFQEEDGE